ncbi:LysE family translocator [Desulfovibrio sp. JC010]|uniref:LysE family translocator n=1 Tax=Desulfovibrio sp. JC010 TaxID=2593641 RepID=UPI0013D7B00B|nr:LysE family translocator [Desulfovibrio sp. JC010]
MPALEITIFAFATCATPGPVNIVASLLGSQNGIKVSIPFVLGATLGLSFVILVASFGVSQILKTNETLANGLTLIGSIYLLYLAFLMSQKNSTIEIDSETNQTAGFYQGAILQLLNPKAWLVSMSGLAMYLNASENSMLTFYILMFFIACFFSVFIWVCLGSLIATKLKSTHLTIFNRSMAALLIILVFCNLSNML